ncbi:hypothetical protein OG579_13655 [Williamsia herbipolensis]|uniref:Uncharacterized protein n=1 Tax=Williamsia herbipolensis TaxID=1603258 RepID=A0AAU4JY76_9NOCA|nr:hypothetical protein [Williamsia herbipolensis]
MARTNRETRPGDDELRFLDPTTRRPLDDVGLPGSDLAETVDADGSVVLWIVDRDRIYDRGVDLGDEQPPHDLTGALPAPWRSGSAPKPTAPVCGAPTATGKACGIRVAGGARCHHHRAAAPKESR